MCAKYYENSTVLSRVIAKNVGDVFLRHTVVKSKRENNDNKIMNVKDKSVRL